MRVIFFSRLSFLSLLRAAGKHPAESLCSSSHADEHLSVLLHHPITPCCCKESASACVYTLRVLSLRNIFCFHRPRAFTLSQGRWGHTDHLRWCRDTGDGCRCSSASSLYHLFITSLLNPPPPRLVTSILLLSAPQCSGNAGLLGSESNICCLCSLLKLPDQWDPHGSPQANLSGPVLPPGTPFPNQPQHRTSVPDSTEGFDLNKPDPYDLYEKSRAIYESRRECRGPSGFFQRILTLNDII